jgi:heparan-alpha-glucosaminide N-acetyltransferase
MSAAGAAQTATSVATTASTRIVSIDIFRGLTIAVMIFVNELAEVRGLPWWTYHAHASQDVMTYVDMVFPFFLFIVGLSMPLAIDQRLKRNPSLGALWVHVFVRSFSLIVLGLILANAEKVDAAKTGMSGSMWGLVGLISAGLFLNVYPHSQRFPRYATVLRGAGLAGVAICFALFRRVTPDGRAAWIDPSYPEILGLIGIAYLTVAVLYIPTRRRRWAAPAWFVLLLALCALTAAKIVVLPQSFSWYVWPVGNGSHVALVMAGVVASQILFGVRSGVDGRPNAKAATVWAIASGLLALAAGWLFAPLGISKIRATPAWTLWNAGAALLAFTLLYWICDQRRQSGWAVLFRPAGANTLLTYLLPDLWYFLLGAVGFTYFESHLNFGWVGAIRSLVFTLLMLAFSAAFTRAKVRLQL